MQVNLPKGYGYVEFKTRADAEKAQLHMDGVSFQARHGIYRLSILCHENDGFFIFIFF